MWWWHGDQGWGASPATTAGMLASWELPIWGVATLTRAGKVGGRR